MDDFPAAQPGRLIEQARDRLGISQNEAAERAGMSGTRWRQIVKGDAGPMTSKRGVATLARMARVVGVRDDDLSAVGRRDVAGELRQTLTGLEREPTAREVADQMTALANQIQADRERERRETDERIRRLEEQIERLRGEQSG